MSTAAILTRLARRPPDGPPTRPGAAAPPASLARALRHAVQGAAEAGAGLRLVGLGVAEDIDRLDDLMERLEDDLLLVPLVDGPTVAGLLAVDAEARGALIAARTGGVPASGGDPLRAVTATDMALMRPTFLAWTQALATIGLPGWRSGLGPGEVPWPDSRAAVAALPDGLYRALRLGLDLGGRQGLAVLILPCGQPAAAPPPEAGDALWPTLSDAPVPVEAVLSEVQVTLAEVDHWVAGDIVALPGVTVGTARLVSRTDRRSVGRGRIGQTAGRRAIRLDGGETPQLDPHPGLPAPEASV